VDNFVEKDRGEPFRPKDCGILSGLPNFWARTTNILIYLHFVDVKCNEAVTVVIFCGARQQIAAVCGHCAKLPIVSAAQGRNRLIRWGIPGAELTIDSGD
jgi:hypothetical protein